MIVQPFVVFLNSPIIRESSIFSVLLPLQGEMGANILVGLQVPPEEEPDFCRQADELGFEYKDERNNEAFHMFMR